jgi:hypothetical protein
MICSTHMFKLWRRAWLPVLVFCVSGIVQTSPSIAQDNSVKQTGTPITPAQQDHVTASRSETAKDKKDKKANDGNRAVQAAAKPGDTSAVHPIPTTGATTPRATAMQKSPANPGHAPVEKHSAIEQNPKLPAELPLRQAAPSRPAPQDPPNP